MPDPHLNGSPMDLAHMSHQITSALKALPTEATLAWIPEPMLLSQMLTDMLGERVADPESPLIVRLPAIRVQALNFELAWIYTAVL
jgi:hypothetical protein